MEKARRLDDGSDDILEITNPYVERGKKLGREEEKNAIALKMLREGFEIELTAKLTGLKKRKIEQLKRQF